MTFKEKIKPFIPMLPGIRHGFYCGNNSLSDIFILIKYICINSINNNILGKFEKLFCKLSKSKFSVSFGSGRMALFSILKSMKLKKGDEIILPAFTCSVVPNAIIYAGAKPIYVDINFKDFNLDTNLIEKKITKKTIAIYAQHTFGVESNMFEINKIAKKYKLKIIEDNAHYIPNKKSKFNSYASFYSLDHSKVINSFMGGVVSTNSFSVYKKLKKTQDISMELGIFSQLRIFFSLIIEIILLNPYLLWIGKSIYNFLFYFRIIFHFRDDLTIQKPKYYPTKLPNMLSYVAIDKIKNIKTNLNHRKKIAQVLEEQIKWYNFKKKDIQKNTWLRYSFLVKDRKKFIKKFNKNYDLDIWFSSIFEGRTNNFQEINYKMGSCPVAEFCSKHIVNLPTHKNISVNSIAGFIKENLNWINSQKIKKKIL